MSGLVDAMRGLADAAAALDSRWVLLAFLIVVNVWAFQPDRLVIDAGETINLTLVNRGGLVHDLSIPELDVHLVATPGETTTTGLEVSEAGEYRMVCTVPGHAEAGMIGLIVVGGS